MTIQVTRSSHERATGDAGAIANHHADPVIDSISRTYPESSVAVEKLKNNNSQELYCLIEVQWTALASS